MSKLAGKEVRYIYCRIDPRTYRGARCDNAYVEIGKSPDWLEVEELGDGIDFRVYQHKSELVDIFILKFEPYKNSMFLTPNLGMAEAILEAWKQLGM